MKNLIEIKNIYKYYRMGDTVVKAIDGLSLNLDEGQILCILGKSGSGKSTLLNSIAGLEKVDKGEILIGGHDITKLSEKDLTIFRQLNLGFVFQSYNLLPILSALENVSLGLAFKGVSKEEREKTSFEILKKVGLEDRVYHKPKELSGGQQQRVSIARAFANNPKIIFADEPTGNLDTNTSKDIMDLITDMIHKNKQTMIIVTHNEELTSYADKVIEMKDGKIIREI
ncbi:ABC transporter ATP-binding protein [Mediannikoviicoccus vaginalis]|uniref:ABC transporter ATP-binding protein n=1 Tax=Mediannikoviicoccus vaginalis TaxID=2899727 RepID=UPI001F28BF54|nr:ABC transporter ATP-binding protein [Mediannikoviicoccus vaginalis]